MLQLIVFDWDGTLVDSVPKILACKQYLAKQYRLVVPTEETVRAVIGKPFNEAMCTCFPDCLEQILDKLKHEFHILMQQPRYQADLFPNAYQTLSWLKDTLGLKLAVATAKARIELDSALCFTQLQTMFDITCCAEEHANKPDPTMLNYITEKLNISKQACLMVGDTGHDLNFAMNAGVQPLGVTFGAAPRTTLEEAINVLQQKSLNSSYRDIPLVDSWQTFVNSIEKLCGFTAPFST